MTEAKLQKAVAIYAQKQAMEELFLSNEKPDSIELIFRFNDEEDSKIILQKDGALYKEFMYLLRQKYDDVKKEFENL